MPKWGLITLVVCIAVVVTSKAQTCPSSGAPGWSTQLRQLLPDCINSVESPNGKLVFQIGRKEQIRVLRNGDSLPLKGNPKLDLPAVISWSPLSTDFFVTDGKGSGLYSQLRMFRISEHQVEESPNVNVAVTKIYRSRNHCSASSDNPNVYGIGWSTGGQSLYVVAQATVNQPCGHPDEYLGFIVNARTYEVEQTLQAAEARSHFGKILPNELR